MSVQVDALNPRSTPSFQYNHHDQPQHRNMQRLPPQYDGQGMQGSLAQTSQHTQEPEFFSGTRGPYTFTLQVVQQPERARMCGFGDKDRRPITPPPCVRLIITETASGREISPSDISSQHFILNVDLWDAGAQRRSNLVRAANNAPSVSISMAATTSYPPPPDAHPTYMVPVRTSTGETTYQHVPVSMHNGQYYAQQPYAPPIPVQPPNTTGMFTRNLIGSVTVSAATLNDTNNVSGFWFVLQDLSVRQEGSFRLKMSFVDVGHPNQPGQLNSAPCPVLAWCFSDAFTVHSAKKFPGVKESTSLSKCFASQGVKIPIRKDGKREDEDD